MKLAVYFVLALLAGAFLPFQAGVNGQLKSFVGGPAQAAFVSFAAGAAALLIYLLASRSSFADEASGASWWMWIGGGLLGACYVSLIIFLTRYSAWR